MKLIIDLDDVLFNNTKGVKVKIFEVLVRHGVLNVEEIYHKKRENDSPFSLKDFIHGALALQGVVGVNDALLALIREMKIGKDDCYIVTSGEEGYQNDKMKGSGLSAVFNAPCIVGHSKKGEVERICRKFGEEEVIFIDDKDKFFMDIDMEVCKNLTTVLYNENGLENLRTEITKSRESDKKI